MAGEVLTLLVTANVGSIFEDPANMLELWSNEFLKTVVEREPQFIALHCQEVGGKNYEKSMAHVEKFVSLLLNSAELRDFDRVQMFIDEDYSSAEHFTALGNFYFVHSSLKNVLIYDFKKSEFIAADGVHVHSGNIEAVATKEKAKFPQDFFPECKWSRKGFLRTRWSLDGTVFDLVNIHLFHDASNFVAMDAYPSVYSENRRRALKYTLKRFHNDKYGVAPFFLFGDFNFRLDTGNVVKKLTDGMSSTKDHNKLKFVDENNETIVIIGVKEFTHSRHDGVFMNYPDNLWIRDFDREMDDFVDELHEFPITFAPSYPFSESVALPCSYMHTRVPAWCDRVLLSKPAKNLVSADDARVKYGIVGVDTCMGDHKPVFLTVTLRTRQGTVKCCTHTRALTRANQCTCCDRYASITINITDYSDAEYAHESLSVDTTLLYSGFPKKEQLTHDPYTPESVESHSPVFDGDDQAPVSASLLKTRLEGLQNILRQSGSLLRIDRLSGKSGVSRSRCNSEIIRGNCDNWRESLPSPRVRLKSTSSLNAAFITARFEGHHSSSEEEWYEQDDDVDVEINSSQNLKCLDHQEDGGCLDENESGQTNHVNGSCTNSKTDRTRWRDFRDKWCCRIT